MLLLLVILIFLYVVCDVNYFIRTYFTVVSGRLYQRKYSLNEVTCIYGVCTFQDCDISLRSLRLSRVTRELDFARYHFYDRTGIYQRSRELGIHSLQGSTLIIHGSQVPLFLPYKISCKLVYWDERSLFLEHELTTLNDDRVRARLISRQYALSPTGDSTAAMLRGLPSCESRPECPHYLQLWLESMQISSSKLNKMKL